MTKRARFFIARSMSEIANISEALNRDFGLVPVMAAEIECYVALPEITQQTVDGFFGPVAEQLKACHVPLLRIEKERGDTQFELITRVTTPEYLAASLGIIRQVIEQHAAAVGVECSFAGKPFRRQPSSGLHLHLHLADAQGINAYHKTEEWTSDALRWSLGGLLYDMKRHLPIFFPTDEDYDRLKDADHVPKIANWGVNNRYCALRIPMEPDPYNKRIEHRVPSANADPAAAIEAMLKSVHRGITLKIEPPEQEYGKPTIGLLESLGLSAALS